MREKLKILPLAVVLILSLLTIAFPHPAFAQTDVCGTHDPTSGALMNGTDGAGQPTTIPDPPGVISGSRLGGWNGQFGEAQTVYSNNINHTVTNRTNAMHQMVQDSYSINGSVDYCFSQIKNIYDAISSSSLDLEAVAIGLIIDRAIQGLIAALCQMVITTINTAIQQTLGIINNLLCVPMPRLQVPGIHIPGLPSTTCHGTSLVRLGLVPQTPNNVPPNRLIWTLWKGKANINAQQ